jgi:hypothetical protein
MLRYVQNARLDHAAAAAASEVEDIFASGQGQIVEEEARSQDPEVRSKK